MSAINSHGNLSYLKYILYNSTFIPIDVSWNTLTKNDEKTFLRNVNETLNSKPLNLFVYSLKYYSYTEIKIWLLGTRIEIIII